MIEGADKGLDILARYLGREEEVCWWLAESSRSIVISAFPFQPNFRALR
jgi:hypothetical protein